MGVYIGDHDESAARKLWNSLPPIYRQCAVAYTDFWAAYGGIDIKNVVSEIALFAGDRLKIS